MNLAKTNNMQTFLEQIANYFITKHLTELNDFCFVFPGKRAALFFNRYLSRNVKQVIWAPRTITITELYQDLCPLPVADPISLLFKLHLSYKKVVSPDITIDEFIPSGEMILNDFNDIDKYLIDTQLLYSNIYALKELSDDYSHLSEEQKKAIQSFWSSFNPDNISKQQEFFLQQWGKMDQLYNEFRKDLLNDNEAYEGMLYRFVAEKTKEEGSLTLPYKKIIFSGFNALNSCEKILFKHLRDQKTAMFFWDYPKWIMNNEGEDKAVEHEASIFLKSNLIDFPSPNDWIDSFADSFPEITIASAPNELVQAQTAHQYLKEFAELDQEHENTAILLADEQQLLPILYSLPSEYPSINVTLGYPLKNTPAFSLVESLLTLQHTTRVTKKGKTWFYYKDVISLLRHQYITLLTKGENNVLVNELIKSNQIFIEKEQLSSFSLIKNIFTKVTTQEELPIYLKELLLKIYQALKVEQNNNIETEFIFHLYLTIKRLSDILSNWEEKPSIETWKSLFKKLAAKRKVPFQGEPVKGLQVMGVLESRTLDFKNLVIIGLNEGVFPATSYSNTLIPYNLRRGYGLPAKENQDAIFAYYFYRLIHRAKTVKLIYTTSQSLTEEGEMSRFLQQLYYEYEGKLITESVRQEVNSSLNLKIIAHKTPEVISKLDEWLKPGGPYLSPSALSTYIECPLRFYYKYIVGIKEAEEIIEDLDPRVFGNLFHQLIEKLYSQFIGLTIEPKDIQAIMDNKSLLKSVFDEVFSKNIPFIGQESSLFIDLQGKNFLVYEVLQKYMLRFLECDRQDAPFILDALEENVKTQIELENGLTVNIGGNIDRVDIKNGVLRIIDYKTGKAQKKITNIEDLFNQEKHSDQKAVFQTSLYALIKSRTTEHSHIQPCVISIRDLYGEYDINLYMNKNVITFDSIKENFLPELDFLLMELFNPAIPFEQTTNVKNCDYCLFRQHCQRD